MMRQRGLGVRVAAAVVRHGATCFMASLEGGGVPIEDDEVGADVQVPEVPPPRGPQGRSGSRRQRGRRLGSHELTHHPP